MVYLDFSQHCHNYNVFRGVLPTRRTSIIQARKRHFLECSLGLAQLFYASVNVLQSFPSFVIDQSTLDLLMCSLWSSDLFQAI